MGCRVPIWHSGEKVSTIGMLSVPSEQEVDCKRQLVCAALILESCTLPGRLSQHHYWAASRLQSISLCDTPYRGPWCLCTVVVAGNSSPPSTCIGTQTNFLLVTTFLTQQITNYHIQLTCGDMLLLNTICEYLLLIKMYNMQKYLIIKNNNRS